ncbi:adenylate/guanylate cyclase domain-containing protein [Chachezhania sediminis]|uniref:adenylate/guanylate cyclase domain-containing protein n=1 Tax=Chachezhania sediminis TaxID=2599291 RepID=UPI001E629EB8|nr:adenylate/guanylate cyclase domain-containing protein [Chachezhania sediminis]
MPEKPTTLIEDASDGPVRSGRRRFSVPLKATILVVFVLTTVPVLGAIVEINRRSSDKVARAHAAEMVERFRTETIREIVTEFDALISVITTAAELGREAPDIFTDNRALRYLFSLLQQSETMLNVYVGLEDGSFRQARRIQDPTAEIHGVLPPPGSEYAYRLVEPSQDAPTMDRYIFLDVDRNELGEVAAETGYDPRRRPWYNFGVSAGTTTITDPELFWAFGLLGFTVAAPYSVDGALAGVVAADVTLDSFSDYLAQKPVSPNSVSLLLDDRGLVLAASDGSANYGADNQRVALPHVADVENRLVSLAYSQRPEVEGDDGEVYGFTYNGADYIVGLSSFEEDLGKPWRLMVLTPLSDFTAEFARNSRQMLIIGLAAIAVQLTIIYIIASLVASPLQRLAMKVTRIQSLESSADLPLPRSRVREVDMLSHAIDTLDTAVQSFARFVPIGLVRELLKSDRKLELGGQSRFLTILFCDVEAFSTLAERIAARDLLARISTLLSVVNKRVHEERGTIDKFIGDGVMAFWGAPAALDDHAWHGCVAALAIQRDLDRLNAEWRSDDAPEMRLRIGIHSDVVLVGNVGSKERMSYTVLGDGVNIASRLEGCNKIYGTLVCISHDTFREAGDRVCVRPIDEVYVKGRRASVIIYELMGAYGAGELFVPDPETVEVARITRQAFDALVAGDKVAAVSAYRAVLAIRPDDPVAKLHVERLEAGKDLPGGAVRMLGNGDG